jgi:hypothetical protein
MASHKKAKKNVVVQVPGFTDHSVLSPYHSTDEVLSETTLDLKIDIFVDQIQNWILGPAEALVSTAHCERAVLMLATSYFEPIACYLSGRESEGGSRDYFRSGLLAVFPEIAEHPLYCKDWLGQLDSPPEVPSDFVERIVDETCQSVYRDLRCGLFHMGLLRPRILLTRGIALSCIFDPGDWQVQCILIDPLLFLERVQAHLQRYVAALRHSSGVHRDNFERLWNTRFLPEHAKR